MKYSITRLVLGFRALIEISAEEFERIRDAKAKLILALDLEEKLDFVLENYADYERELLNLTLHQMLFHDLDWSAFRLNVQLINRRLANLLASGRLYVDQVRHGVSRMYGPESEQFAALDSEITNVRNGSFPYRFMDAVRNYMQHRSLPIHHLSYPSRWERASGVDRLQFSIVPSVETKRLQDDEKFKRSVLEEREAREEYIGLTPLVRGYVESIGRIHDSVRNVVHDGIATWDSLIENTLERAVAEFGNKIAGVAIVARAEDGRIVDTEEIFEDLIRHRKLLLRKNHFLGKLSARYVTGASQERSP